MAPSAGVPRFETTVRIKRDAGGIAKWWFEFPTDYRAVDPREQPYRIDTLRRTDDMVEVLTHWRMMGVRLKLPETITRRDPRSFDAHIRMGGLDVYDQFRLVEDGEGGSLMRIATQVRGRTLLGRMMAPLAAPMLHAWMKKIWGNAASLCEEDAARSGTPSGNARS